MSTLQSRRQMLQNSLREAFNFQQTLWQSRLSQMGKGLDPVGRDLDAECGYNTANPTDQYFRDLYEQHGVAARVVDIWPDECWAVHPTVYERESRRRTQFEIAWERVETAADVWTNVHRADRLSRVNSYGVLLLGLSSGDPNDDLSFPAPGLTDAGVPREGRTAPDLMYLRPFDQRHAKISKTEGDVFNPRFGQPTEYEIDLSGPPQSFVQGSLPVNPSRVQPTVSRRVHWTRVIHLADNCESSEIFGVPACRKVIPYLSDIRKIAGGSGEMFWRGAFPGYAFETNPDASGDILPDIDEESIKEEIQNYVNGLQRYLTAVGGSWKALSPQVADPGPHLTQQLQLLCASIGVPVRIFLGSEAAHLASTQDAITWKDRLRGRQVNYLEPKVVRRLIDRLVLLGVLPRVPKYTVEWRDLRTLGEKDLADVALKKVQALMQYVTGGVFELIPPRQLFTLFLGFTDDTANALVEIMGGEERVTKALRDMAEGQNAQPLGGGRVGNPSAKNTGRPANGPPSES